MTRKIFLLLMFVLILAGCAVEANQADQTNQITNNVFPTDTTEVLPSPTPFRATETPTLTPLPSATSTPESYWWDEEETIAYLSYVSNTRDIEMAGLNGFSPENLHSPVVAGDPNWSPDGTKIAFICFDVGIYVVDIYNGEFVKVTDVDDDRMYRPSWSPDSNQFAFASSAGIRIYNLDGEEVLTIPSSVYYDVKWSPDGEYLVIEEYLYQNNDLNLYLYSFSTQTIVPVANTYLMEHFPSWSPDSSKIVYSRDRNNGIGSDLYVYEVATGNTTRLTNSNALKYHPSWSPDGTMIAFEHKTEDSLFDIYVINSTGGGLTQITNFAGREGWPTWSNDGQMIAFSFRSDSRSTNELNAGKVPMEPSGIWMYSFESDSIFFIEGSEDGNFPAWRPVAP